MSWIGQRERPTSQQVVTSFQESLGYNYLGDRNDRESNSNMEEELLTIGRGLWRGWWCLFRRRSPCVSIRLWPSGRASTGTACQPAGRQMRR